MSRYKRYSSRGFTLVELMIVVAIVGILATLAFFGVSHLMGTGKSAEARQNVGAISRAAQAAYERGSKDSKLLPVGTAEQVTPGFPLCGSAIAVPGTPPPGVKYQPSLADWETGSATEGWKCLGFRITDPIQYQYIYTRGTAALSGMAVGANGYEAGAMGDVDNDGVFSKFAITAKVENGQLIRSTNLWMDAESE